MNTRSIDLDILDQSRNITESEDARLHREALLDRIYQQSKDTTLEKMRMELTRWIQHGLAYVPENGVPTLKQKQELATAEINITRLEKEIKAYVNSDTYKRSIAQKIAKKSSTKADLIMKGEL